MLPLLSFTQTFGLGGAFSFPTGSKDAAVVVTLPADAGHTAIVTGVDGATSQAMVEIYDLP